MKHNPTPNLGTNGIVTGESRKNGRRRSASFRKARIRLQTEPTYNKLGFGVSRGLIDHYVKSYKSIGILLLAVRIFDVSAEVIVPIQGFPTDITALYIGMVSNKILDRSAIPEIKSSALTIATQADFRECAYKLLDLLIDSGYREMDKKNKTLSPENREAEARKRREAYYSIGDASLIMFIEQFQENRAHLPMNVEEEVIRAGRSRNQMVEEIAEHFSGKSARYRKDLKSNEKTQAASVAKQ